MQLNSMLNNSDLIFKMNLVIVDTCLNKQKPSLKCELKTNFQNKKVNQRSHENSL